MPSIGPGRTRSGTQAVSVALPAQNLWASANGISSRSPGPMSRRLPLAVSNVQRPCATRWKMLMWCRCASGVRSSKRFGLSIRKGAVNEPPKNTDPVSRTARNISDSTSGRARPARRIGK